jgi:nucleoside-diphosphate-sugar epimerase
VPEPPSRLFVFGLGYSARRLAHALIARGWSVAGTCRDPSDRAVLRADGIDAHVFERTRPLDPSALASTTHLLSSVPPDEAGDPVIDCHSGDIARMRSLAWAGYLSTTGVYGDRGGARVGEADPPRPASARARRRVAAEEGWLGLHRTRGVPVHVFRLAGIYGPGRSTLDQVRAGTARRIVKPGHAFSRIHVDDIVNVLRASMARPDPGAVYNLCDDEAAPSADVVAHACALLGVAPPPEIPFATATLSELSRSFFAENRRVANDRIKRDLGVRLLYPSYREGLVAILAEEGGGVISADPRR